MATDDYQATWRGARRYQFDEEARRKATSRSRRRRLKTTLAALLLTGAAGAGYFVDDLSGRGLAMLQTIQQSSGMDCWIKGNVSIETGERISRAWPEILPPDAYQPTVWRALVLLGSRGRSSGVAAVEDVTLAQAIILATATYWCFGPTGLGENIMKPAMFAAVAALCLAFGIVSASAHGGGCRKSSPPGQCCHMDNSTGSVHCH